MKKCFQTALSVLLTAVLLMTVVPLNVSVAAAEKLTFTVSTKSVVPGETVAVDIAMTNNPGIASVGLNIGYDRSILTIENITFNSVLGGTTQTSQLTQNPAKIIWISSASNYNGDTTVATVTFRANGGITQNVATAIELSYDADDIYDITEKNIDCDVVNGTVNVVVTVPGDINGDTKVNNKDVTRLLQYLAHWNVEVNESALDTNGDGKVNNKDVSRLMQYLAHWNVQLFAGGSVTPTTCTHTLTKVDAVTSTVCEQDGNITYWHCSKCGRYFDDAAATHEIKWSDTIVPSTGHIPVTVYGYPATTDHSGLTDGCECKICHKVIKEQTVIPRLNDGEYSITYDLCGNDDYLKTLWIDNSDNPVVYSSSKGVSALKTVKVDGYRFEGWYDAPGSNGVEVKSISAGTTGNKVLYARWSQEVYDVTYKLYQTPLKPISDTKFLHYTTGKGLPDLPNPTLYNYIFLGWYTDDGKEVKNIPVGTTGNITLNAYWTSRRNLTKSAAKIDDPIIVENTKDGIVYYAYEIGTIENVPLTDAIWSIQAVSGLEQQRSETVKKQISTSNAQTISNTISKATVDSGTWTLSENWNENTQVSETWANQNGMQQSEANTKVKTASNTYAFTTANGGSSSQVDNTGTSTLGYDSQNYEHGNGVELSAKAHYNASLEAKGSIKLVDITGKVDYGIEVGGKYNQQQKTNEKSGSDTTTLDTHTHTENSSWNNSSTSSSTHSASESESFQKVLSQVITDTKGYGKSYTNGGSSVDTQGFSSTNSESINTSSTLTYSTTDITETTSTYSTDGKSEGKYRLVIAGTIHVFGVVGYDMGSRSYFASTFNVMDDKTYEFLDYSPSEFEFNDYQNGCIPFEVPDDIYQYVCCSTCYTEGLSFKTNTADGTATVLNYKGTDSDVLIPSYYTTDGTAYRVTGIESSAFAGKPVRAIKLSRFIKEIPNSAFAGCSSLEEISGYYTEVGDNAFDGCSSLDKQTLSPYTTKIGTEAFRGVEEIDVHAMSEELAIENTMAQNPQQDGEDDSVYSQRIRTLAYEQNVRVANAVAGQAVLSGASRITLNLDKTFDKIEYDLEVPETDYFAIQGGKKNFRNFKLQSQARETSLREMVICDCSSVPLEIASEILSLNAVSVTSPVYALLLSHDGATVNLKRDNRLISQNGKAMVCKNPKLVSSGDSTVGMLDVSGNIYLCGEMSTAENLTFLSGGIQNITEAEFENYIKGCFTVTFDPTSGTLNNPAQEKREVFIGSAYGKFPAVTYDYHRLAGWYTAKKGGTRVLASDIFEGNSDMTLYARWAYKPSSDWVLEEDVPSDAMITSDAKWTYDLTSYMDSKNSSENGWTLVSSEVQYGNWGNWSNWSRTAYTKSDTRDVQSQYISAQYKTQWNYSKWTQYSNGYGTNGPTQNTWGGAWCGNYFERGWSDSPLSIIEWQTAYGNTFALYGSYSDTWYNEWTRQVETQSAYTQYRYRDRSKWYLYHYKKVESLESDTEITQTTDISNVKKWVKYIEK